MEQWKREISASQTSYDLFRVMRRIANTYGFAFFSVLRVPGPTTTRLSEAMLISNLHPDFLRAHDEFGLLTANPLFGNLAGSVEPVVHVASHETSPRMKPEAATRLRELLDDFGIGLSAFFPVYAGDGTKGIVGFLGDCQTPSTAELLELHRLSFLAFDRLHNQSGAAKAPAGVLTERERQCLYWTAAGKTSVEIAGILGISAHTVDHYLTTAGQKLDTVNRAHTVATALRKGLIE